MNSGSLQLYEIVKISHILDFLIELPFYLITIKMNSTNKILKQYLLCT